MSKSGEYYWDEREAQSSSTYETPRTTAAETNPQNSANVGSTYSASNLADDLSNTSLTSAGRDSSNYVTTSSYGPGGKSPCTNQISGYLPDMHLSQGPADHNQFRYLLIRLLVVVGCTRLRHHPVRTWAIMEAGRVILRRVFADSGQAILQTQTQTRTNGLLPIAVIHPLQGLIQIHKMTTSQLGPIQPPMPAQQDNQT